VRGRKWWILPITNKFKIILAEQIRMGYLDTKKKNLGFWHIRWDDRSFCCFLFLWQVFTVLVRQRKINCAINFGNTEVGSGPVWTARPTPSYRVSPETSPEQSSESAEKYITEDESVIHTSYRITTNTRKKTSHQNNPPKNL
jgi:hypothetical protein